MLETLSLLLDRGGDVREAGHGPRVSSTALAVLSATWCAVLLVLLLLGSPDRASSRVRAGGWELARVTGGKHGTLLP